MLRHGSCWRAIGLSEGSYPQILTLSKKGHKAHAKEFPVVSLHKICHRMIHALFSEKFLVEHLNTIEALRAHPAMQSFLEFIEDKPPSFDVRVRGNKEKRQREKPGILP